MTRRSLITLIAVGLLLAAIDFSQRIYVPSETRARGEGSFQPAVVPIPLTAAQIQQDLVSWLPSLKPVADSSGADADGEVAIDLLAVFVDRERAFAVVRAVPAAGGGARIQSVAQGDQLYGFTVARIEPLKLVLTSERGDQDLQLFKPLPRTARAAAIPRASAAPLSVPAPPGTTAQEPAPTAAAGAAGNAGWKPGAPIQLPESMRGLKVVEVPPPPTGAAPKAAARPAQPPLQSQNP